MAALVGKWTQDSTENYEALLDAAGTPADAKKALVGNKIELELSFTDDNWTLKSNIVGTDKKREQKFKLGAETDGVSIVGQTIKFTTKMEGEVQKEVAKSSDGKTLTTERFIEGGLLILKMTCNDVVGKLKFKKIS